MLLLHEQEVSAAHTFLSRGGELKEPVWPPAQVSSVISSEPKESTAEVVEDLGATLDKLIRLQPVHLHVREERLL